MKDAEICLWKKWKEVENMTECGMRKDAEICLWKKWKEVEKITE